MRTLKLVGATVAAAVLVASCGGTTTGDPDEPDLQPATASLAERIDAIDDAVAIWRSATSNGAARAAAETAANLVVGPDGPGYGDRDGDGVILGATATGLLPGLDGTPAGLAIPLSPNDCVARDVLGGAWTDPGGRWAEMLTAIDNWRTDNNTMPSLASHPMRVVGWATFTLDSDSLEDARGYAGHANLHVDISRRALDC